MQWSTVLAPRYAHCPTIQLAAAVPPIEFQSFQQLTNGAVCCQPMEWHRDGPHLLADTHRPRASSQLSKEPVQVSLVPNLVPSDCCCGQPLHAVTMFIPLVNASASMGGTDLRCFQIMMSTVLSTSVEHDRKRCALNPPSDQLCCGTLGLSTGVYQTVLIAGDRAYILQSVCPGLMITI